MTEQKHIFRILDKIDEEPGGFNSLPLGLSLSVLIASLLSLFSLIWLLCNIHNLHSRSYSIKIIYNIAFLNAIEAALIIVYYGIPDVPPVISQYLNLIASLANLLSFLWTTALAYHSYGIITRLHKFNQQRFYKQSLLAIYPGFLLFVAIDMGIRYFQAFQNVQLHFVIYLAMTILCVLFSVFLYFKQKHFVKHYFPKELLQNFNINLGKLTLYPLGQVIIYAPTISGLILRTINVTDLISLNYALVIATSIQGFLQAILYRVIRNTATSDIKMQDKQDEEDVPKNTQISMVDELNTDKLLQDALLD